MREISLKTTTDNDRIAIKPRNGGTLPTPLLLLLIIATLGILSAFAIAMRSRGTPFLVAIGSFALIFLLCTFLLLRRFSAVGTTFDFERGTVKINTGARAKMMHTGDVLCIRRVTREPKSFAETDEKIAWCLFAKGDSYFEGLLICPFFKKDDNYARELDTVIVPKIEARLGLDASAKPRTPVLAVPTCFKRTGRVFEHAANSMMGMLSIVLMALITLFFIVYPLLTPMGKPNIADLLLLLPLLLLSAGIPLYQAYRDIAKTDRRIVVDTGKRTISTYRGFSRRPHVFPFDDLKHVYIGISNTMFGSARQQSVHFAFGEDEYRVRIANGKSEKAEKIFASYALVMNTDLSGKIEYIA